MGRKVVVAIQASPRVETNFFLLMILYRLPRQAHLNSAIMNFFRLEPLPFQGIDDRTPICRVLLYYPAIDSGSEDGVEVVVFNLHNNNQST